MNKDDWVQFNNGLADLNRHISQLNFRSMDVLIRYAGASDTLHHDLTLIKMDLERIISIVQKEK